MKGFGELEGVIMDVLWTRGGPATVREVLTELCDHRDIVHNPGGGCRIAPGPGGVRAEDRRDVTTVALIGFAAALAFTAPRLPGRATWAYRAPWRRR